MMQSFYENLPPLFTGYEVRFLIDLLLACVAGILIGAERESRGKDAGISTHTLVIAGAMMFSFLSSNFDPSSKSRIAAQIVSGVGFLGAGLIIKGEMGKVRNLTTAASVWFAAGIGMAIGFGFYLIAISATLVCALVPKIPHVDKASEE